MQFMSEKMKAYYRTRKGDESNLTWIAQRDRTRQLTEFENLALRDTRKVILTLLQLFATLDDEIFGTRAADNPVKTLSCRKVNREGESAEAIADALFRVVFGIRFRLRGEAHVQSVIKLQYLLLDGLGENFLNTCIVTADRGYGRGAFSGVVF